MNETWKPIPGYGQHYEASDLGRVRVKARMVEKLHRSGAVMRQQYAGRMLAPSQSDKWGHQSVHLGVDRKKISVAVHTLILLAFLGPRPEGTEACHNNGDAGDNRLCNLRWDTHLENNRDRHRHGRYATGEAHHAFKFGDEQTAAIRSGAVGLAKAMREFGISRTHFYRVKRGGA